MPDPVNDVDSKEKAQSVQSAPSAKNHAKNSASAKKFEQVVNDAKLKARGDSKQQSQTDGRTQRAQDGQNAGAGTQGVNAPSRQTGSAVGDTAKANATDAKSSSTAQPSRTSETDSRKDNKTASDGPELFQQPAGQRAVLAADGEPQPDGIETQTDAASGDESSTSEDPAKVGADEGNALVTLAKYFPQLESFGSSALGGRTTKQKMSRAADDSNTPSDLKTALNYFLNNSGAFDKLDTAAKDDGADGTISAADLGRRLESIAKSQTDFRYGAAAIAILGNDGDKKTVNRDDLKTGLKEYGVTSITATNKEIDYLTNDVYGDVDGDGELTIDQLHSMLADGSLALKDGTAYMNYEAPELADQIARDVFSSDSPYVSVTGTRYLIGDQIDSGFNVVGRDLGLRFDGLKATNKQLDLLRYGYGSVHDDYIGGPYLQEKDLSRALQQGALKNQNNTFFVAPDAADMALPTAQAIIEEAGSNGTVTARQLQSGIQAQGYRLVDGANTRNLRLLVRQYASDGGELNLTQLGDMFAGGALHLSGGALGADRSKGPANEANGGPEATFESIEPRLVEILSKGLDPNFKDESVEAIKAASKVYERIAPDLANRIKQALQIDRENGGLLASSESELAALHEKKTDAALTAAGITDLTADQIVEHLQRAIEGRGFRQYLDSLPEEQQQSELDSAMDTLSGLRPDLVATVGTNFQLNRKFGGDAGRMLRDELAGTTPEEYLQNASDGEKKAALTAFITNVLMTVRLGNDMSGDISRDQAIKMAEALARTAMDFQGVVVSFGNPLHQALSNILATSPESISESDVSTGIRLVNQHFPVVNQALDVVADAIETPVKTIGDIYSSQIAPTLAVLAAGTHIAGIKTATNTKDKAINSANTGLDIFSMIGGSYRLHNLLPDGWWTTKKIANAGTFGLAGWLANQDLNSGGLIANYAAKLLDGLPEGVRVGYGAVGMTDSVWAFATQKLDGVGKLKESAKLGLGVANVLNGLENSGYSLLRFAGARRITQQGRSAILNGVGIAMMTIMTGVSIAQVRAAYGK